MLFVNPPLQANAQKNRSDPQGFDQDRLGLRRIGAPVCVMVTFRFCSAVQAISVSEGTRFSKPRALPSLYYTC